MSGDPILIEKDGVVATLVLNNPTKRNALTLAAWGALSDAIAMLDADTGLRCVVVKGAGDKAFAAGADISEFPENRADGAQAYEYGKATEAALMALQNCVHPTIAAIRGACTGGGLEIAACCDLRIASDNAKFGVPINRIGHAFAAAEMKPVLDLVGKAVVLELLLEGGILTAEAAMAKGLLTRVVADSDLERELAETVARIAGGAPLGARMTKKLVNRLLNSTGPLNDTEVRESYVPCDSEDYAEGVAAFLAKRPPVFNGR